MEIGYTNEDLLNDEFTVKLNTYEILIATFKNFKSISENEIALCALNNYDFNILKLELSNLPKTNIEDCNFCFSDILVDEKKIVIMGVRIVRSDFIEKGKCKPFTRKEVDTFAINYNPLPKF